MVCRPIHREVKNKNDDMKKTATPRLPGASPLCPSRPSATKCRLLKVAEGCRRLPKIRPESGNPNHGIPGRRSIGIWPGIHQSGEQTLIDNLFRFRVFRVFRGFNCFFLDSAAPTIPSSSEIGNLQSGIPTRPLSPFDGGEAACPRHLIGLELAR